LLMAAITDIAIIFWISFEKWSPKSISLMTRWTNLKACKRNSSNIEQKSEATEAKKLHVPS
jgi:hypothetical protein